MKIKLSTQYTSQRRPSQCYSLAGFTLIEILFLIGLAGILLAIAAPNMRDFIQQSEAENLSRQMMQDFEFARQHAISSQVRTSICASNDGATCASDSEAWLQGWILFEDRSANFTRKTDDKLLVVRTHAATLQMKNNSIQQAMSYLPNGRSRMQNSLGTGTITFCTTTGNRAYKMVINQTGRLRLEKLTHPKTVCNSSI